MNAGIKGTATFKSISQKISSITGKNLEIIYKGKGWQGHFSIKYPDSMIVCSYNDGDDTIRRLLQELDEYPDEA
jgi:hypothetical protein